MAVLLKTLELLVTQEGRRITIRERQTIGYLLGVFFLALGAGFYWLGGGNFFGLLGEEGEGLGSFSLWVGYVVLPLSILLLLVSGFRSLRKPITINGDNGKVILPGRTIDFLHVQEVKVTRTQVLDQVRYGLALEAGGKSVRLVSFQDPKRTAVLEQLRGLIEGLVGSAAAIEEERAEIAEDVDDGRRFLAILLLAMGLIWAVSAFLLVPDLAFSRRSQSPGLLVWPLGIWIFLLGVCEWFKLPVMTWLREPPLWRRVLVDLIWFGSYALFALADLG